jgi:hypothetical protein
LSFTKGKNGLSLARISVSIDMGAPQGLFAEPRYPGRSMNMLTLPA